MKKAYVSKAYQPIKAGKKNEPVYQLKDFAEIHNLNHGALMASINFSDKITASFRRGDVGYYKKSDLIAWVQSHHELKV